jgi:hypothetical protein
MYLQVQGILLYTNGDKEICVMRRKTFEYTTSLNQDNSRKDWNEQGTGNINNQLCVNKEVKSNFTILDPNKTKSED